MSELPILIDRSLDVHNEMKPTMWAQNIVVRFDRTEILSELFTAFMACDRNVDIV